MVTDHTPTYTGHAAPGSTVRLYAGPVAWPNVLVPIGSAPPPGGNMDGDDAAPRQRPLPRHGDGHAAPLGDATPHDGPHRALGVMTVSITW